MIPSSLTVTGTAAIFAAITLVAGLCSYKWASEKRLRHTALALFALLAVTTVFLILNTEGVNSPFVALWMVIAIFSGIFGLYALIPLLIAVNIYLVLGVLDGSFDKQMILSTVLAGDLPLAISYLIWHNQATHETKHDRAYRDLANELSQVANKAEVVINAIADGVIAIDGHGTIQLINPAAQRMIGWGKQDALNLDYKSVLHLLGSTGKEVTPAEDPVAGVLANNQRMRTDNLSLLTNSEKKLLVSIVLSPVGQPGSGVIIVFRDITKEKTEERAQTEFISTASHEMRTPVAAIEGYLGLALNPATATIDIKAHDYITKAHEAAQHLGRLFQDLLDVTKADDRRLSNNPKVIDVVAFTHDIVKEFRIKAQEKGLRLFFKPIPDDTDDEVGEKSISPVYYAHIDCDHLREVVANLIENAIKYTPKGEVIIDISSDTNHTVISIQDSGIGIPSEDIPHLFQKFYRVDSSDTREIGGTGLGLYLCRRLMETLGGRIWVESEYKHGSTFFVEIPRIDHEQATQLIELAGAQTTPSIDPEPHRTPLIDRAPLDGSTQVTAAPVPPAPQPAAVQASMYPQFTSQAAPPSIPLPQPPLAQAPQPTVAIPITTPIPAQTVQQPVPTIAPARVLPGARPFTIPSRNTSQTVK